MKIFPKRNSTFMSPQLPIPKQTTGQPHNFGTFKLLLIIAQPQVKNTRLATWTLHGFPAARTPNGNPSFPSCQPSHNHILITPTNTRLVGIGNPSKYLAFPVTSLGSEPVVTLKRANRQRPARRKKDRIKVSIVVLRPRTYAITDGATPNEIYYN